MDRLLSNTIYFHRKPERKLDRSIFLEEHLVGRQMNKKRNSIAVLVTVFELIDQKFWNIDFPKGSFDPIDRHKFETSFSLCLLHTFSEQTLQHNERSRPIPSFVQYTPSILLPFQNPPKPFLLKQNRPSIVNLKRKNVFEHFQNGIVICKADLFQF